MARLLGLLALLATALALAGLAEGSIFVGFDAVKPTLAIDANDTALVTFTSKGKPDAVRVPARGQLTHTRSIGADVSKPATVPGLPLASIVRRTPDGTFYALQAWQVTVPGPVELHLARWKGEPTKLTLTSDGKRLSGTASFQGKPVTGTTFTLEGKRPKIYVWLDCFACAGKAGWTRMIGLAPRADGSFRVYLRPQWKGSRFRATVAGPNVGSTFAPDAQTVISAAA